MERVVLIDVAHRVWVEDVLAAVAVTFVVVMRVPAMAAEGVEGSLGISTANAHVTRFARLPERHEGAGTHRSALPIQTTSRSQGVPRKLGRVVGDWGGCFGGTGGGRRWAMVSSEGSRQNGATNRGHLLALASDLHRRPIRAVQRLAVRLHTAVALDDYRVTLSQLVPG
eukprot:SAG31_NODE_12106_length_968_cov_0.845800_2_plen_168_part_01